MNEMRISVLVLVLLPAALAGEDRLRVKVEISKDLSHVKADASGENERVITDDELKIFGITEDVLRNGVREISTGTPDAVFVKDSQSRWSSPFRNYGYDEVTREFEGEKATILKVQSRPYVIATKKVTNNNSYASSIDVGVPYNFPDRITTSWGRFSGINDSSTQVTYEVIFKDRGTRLYSKLPWGQNIQSSHLDYATKTDVRSSNSFVQLSPKETVTVELVATEVIIDLLAKYEIGFEGDVVCHYADGNIFKKFDVETVLKKSNFPENIIVSESVQLVVYPDVRFVVRRNDNKGSS